MSTSVTRKSKGNKELLKSVSVDKEEDGNGLKECLHKVEVFRESE